MTCGWSNSKGIPFGIGSRTLSFVINAFRCIQAMQKVWDYNFFCKCNETTYIFLMVSGLNVNVKYFV